MVNNCSTLNKYCKTCFRTSKWIWHAKTTWSNYKRSWIWVDPPPPCFFKIPTFSRFFSWRRPLWSTLICPWQAIPSHSHDDEEEKRKLFANHWRPFQLEMWWKGGSFICLISHERDGGKEKLMQIPRAFARLVDKWFNWNLRQEGICWKYQEYIKGTKPPTRHDVKTISDKCFLM